MTKLLIDTLEIVKELRISHFSPKQFLICLLFKAETLTNPTVVEMHRFSFLLEWLFLKENESFKSEAIKTEKEGEKTIRKTYWKTLKGSKSNFLVWL